MSKLAQLGTAIAMLGIVLAFMGLFPGTLGFDPTEGIGILQIVVTLFGFALLNLGAYIYLYDTWFRGKPVTLGQSIGIRLTWTGLLFAAAAGMADLLGFGSHPSENTVRPLLGYWQAVSFVLSFLMSALGVAVYALYGDFSEPGEADNAPTDDDADDYDDIDDGDIDVDIEFED
jgi:disulfide bond formation protein DsbB